MIHCVQKLKRFTKTILIISFGICFSAQAVPTLEVNGADADYLTLHYYIDEPTDSDSVLVEFWPNEAGVELAQVWANLDRRDFATLGPQDASSIPGPAPAGTNYFAGFPMTDAGGGKWTATLPFSKTGAYRLTARYKLTGSSSWSWYGKRDTAIVVSPKKSRDVVLYELQVNVINATGDTFATRSTFEDLHDPGSEANLDYFEDLGINTLWIQPIHPIGSHACVTEVPGSPYSIQSMWDVAPHHSDGGTRASSMTAFTNFSVAAKAKNIDFFFDVIFNHTSWDAEIGRNPDNPSLVNTNPTQLIKDILPEWYSRYTSSSFPCDEYSYTQTDFDFDSPAGNANEIGPAPAARNDFGKWPDVADLFWGTYNALFDHTEDHDTYWTINQAGADVARMVEYFTYFGEYWIEKSAGALSGFRCDYAQGIPPQAWEYIINKTRQTKWDFIFMAESLDGGNVSKRAGRHMDIINQNWVWQVLGAGGNTTGLRGIIDQNKTDYGYAGIMRGLINHDQDAPADKWYSFSRYAVGAVIDGAPQMYQGQELGYVNNYGFSQFRFQFSRWIPHIFKYHNMTTLWNNRDASLEDAYARVNRGRKLSPVTRLHDQWYLNQTGGLGTHEDIFSVLKYETFGGDPVANDVVLSFVNLDPWSTRAATFDLSTVSAISLDNSTYYNVRNLCADNPNAYLWTPPGRTGLDIKNNGVYVSLPSDGNGQPDVAFVQMLKLEASTGSSNIQWVGNMQQTPANGAVTSSNTVQIYIETAPTNNAVSGDLVYRPSGSTWQTQSFVKGGTTSSSDWWTASMGPFSTCSTTEYFAVFRDGDSNKTTHNNGGGNFEAIINCSILILQNATQLPDNGSITPADMISLYVESTPPGEGDNGFVKYRVNGGGWMSTALSSSAPPPPGDPTDWWSADIGPFGACDDIEYYFELDDQSSFTVTLDNGGSYYDAHVECLFLVITNPANDITVGNAVAAYNLQGIASTDLVDNLTWSNTASGASGTTPSAASWDAGAIALSVGTNKLIVSGAYTSPGGVSTNAIDDPGNAGYSGGWGTGTNGGTGFGAWTLTPTGGNAGQFIGTSGGSPTLDTGTHGWGMWAHVGSRIDARRDFNAAMQVGDVFTVLLDNNWITENGTSSVGIGLETTTGTERFAFYFVGGEPSYKINDSTNNRSSGVAYTDSGILISVELTGANTYELNAGGTILSGELNGSGSIGRFHCWNNGAGTGSSYDAFVGEMKVVGNSVPITNDLMDMVTIIRDDGTGVPDTDGDTIPDWWEVLYYGGPTNADASADGDGDFVLIIDEYYSGTIPTNGNSYLKTMMMPANGSGTVIVWPSASNRIYELHRSTNKVSVSGFTSLATNILATVPLNTYTDTTATAEGPYFYRVESAME